MKKIIITIIVFALIAGGSIVVFAGSSDMEEERAQLEEELKRLEEEITRTERGLTITEAEKESLQYQIRQLQGQIDHLSAQIQRNKVIIQSLGLQIEDTKGSIQKTTQKIESSREELAETLRIMNMEGRTSVLETIFKGDDLSSFFGNLNSLERLSEGTKNIMDEVRALRMELRDEKEYLEDFRTETEQVARAQELQRQEEEAARREYERIHGMTEEEYQRQLAQREELEKRKREIEEKIFQLVGIPEVEMPTFAEALETAEWVEGKTGIRPAFLLAIIMQESALGRNVGQCYIADASSGTSQHIHNGQYYSNGIHPTRDLPLFLQITKELERDPKQTPVSCPLSYGYGGAMGPAQFIPSTWQSVRPSVSGMLGREADPWRISDSFLASSTLLRNLGGVSNERRAALQYFAGSNWQASHVQFYGDQVANRTNCIQIFIDDGTMSDFCSNLVFIP